MMGINTIQSIKEITFTSLRQVNKINKVRGSKTITINQKDTNSVPSTMMLCQHYCLTTLHRLDSFLVIFELPNTQQRDNPGYSTSYNYQPRPELLLDQQNLSSLLSKS